MIDMFGPIYGRNWLQPRIADGLTYRRMQGGDASIKLPTLGEASMRVVVVLGAQPPQDQLEATVLTVNGAPVRHAWGQHGGTTSLWFEAASPSGAAFELGLQCSEIEGGPNEGLVGLSVSRIDLWSLAESPPVEALQQEISARDATIQELMSSTSWKLTAPLRWFKEALRGERN